MIDRGSVLSPDEARAIIGKLEGRLAQIEGQLRYIENRTPAAAFEALVGPAQWLQLPGASGTWARVPSEIRAGECFQQARERHRLRDEAWVISCAVQDARRQATAYDSEHARYDALASECHRLEARVIRGLLPIVLDPNQPPSAAQLSEYNVAASELQDMAGELLRMSGHRAQWGALSETRPQDRIAPSMYRHILDRLPERARGLWGWRKKTEQLEEARR
jgi:hypothetical protein